MTTTWIVLAVVAIVALMVTFWVCHARRQDTNPFNKPTHVALEEKVAPRSPRAAPESHPAERCELRPHSVDQPLEEKPAGRVIHRFPEDTATTIVGSFTVPRPSEPQSVIQAPTYWLDTRALHERERN